MAFKDHFSSQADSYARYRPSYPAELFHYLASLTPSQQLVWDCATGSGQAAVALTEWFEQVIATDASAQQLQRAQQHPQVSYQVASAEAVPLATASLDLICVAQALHWFDLDAFSTEVRRLLKPGAVLAAWSYGMTQVGSEIDTLIEHFYRDTVGRWWPPERRMVENGYTSIKLPFRAIKTPEFSMQADWELGQLIGYLGSWSAVQRCRSATGRDPMTGFIDKLKQAWGAPPEQARTVRWPLVLKAWRMERS